jgi:hypothetical protein
VLIVVKERNDERRLGEDWVNSKLLSIYIWKAHSARTASPEMASNS